MVSRHLSAAGVSVVAVLVGVGFVRMAQGGQGSTTTPVMGVWRVSEVTFTGPNARQITSPQPSVRIFTRGLQRC